MSSDNRPIRDPDTPAPANDSSAAAVRRQDGEPAKRHGDALLEGNGGRQGAPDPAEGREGEG